MLLTALAIVATLLSAASLHAASPHGRWPAEAKHAFGRKAIGATIAFVALAAWIARLGVAAGVCAMLATWMFAFVCLPYAMSLRRGESR